MSPFEFSFALISLLLGLGFAALADSFAKLCLAGRRVRWDWLSPLVALNAFQAGLVYWWFQWSLRDQPVLLIGLAGRALACLCVYVFSVSALPADKGEPIDLRDHFERSRRLTYGAYLLYWLLVALALPLSAGRGTTADWGDCTALTLMVAGLFIRDRRFNLATQLFLLIIVASTWMLQLIAA